MEDIPLQNYFTITKICLRMAGRKSKNRFILDDQAENHLFWRYIAKKENPEKMQG